MGARKTYNSTIHDRKYKAIVEALVALRKKAALQQSDLAQILGMSQPDISKIERLERRIDALELAKWLQATKGSFDKIIKGLTL